MPVAQVEAGEYRLECGAQPMEVQDQLADVRHALNTGRIARETLLELVSQYADLLARHTGIISQHKELAQRYEEATAHIKQHAYALAAARGEIERRKRKEKDRTVKALKAMEIANSLVAKYGAVIQEAIALRGSLEAAHKHAEDSKTKYEDLKSKYDTLFSTTEEVEVLRARVEDERIEKELYIAECAELKDQVEAQKKLLTLKEVVRHIREQVDPDAESEVVDHEERDKKEWMVRARRKSNHELARERGMLVRQLNEVRTQRDWLTKRLKWHDRPEDNREDARSGTTFEIPDCAAYESLFDVQPLFSLYDELANGINSPGGEGEGHEPPPPSTPIPDLGSYDSLLDTRPLTPLRRQRDNPGLSIDIPDFATCKFMFGIHHPSLRKRNEQGDKYSPLQPCLRGGSSDLEASSSSPPGSQTSPIPFPKGWFRASHWDKLRKAVALMRVYPAAFA